MKIDRIIIRKLLSTACALTVLAGVVALMRFGAQKLAGENGGDFDFASVEMPIGPAVREFDLDRLVPDEYGLSVAGMDVARNDEHLQMPVGLAERVLADRAVAAGWKRVDSPEAELLNPGELGQSTWQRPDGQIVFRRCRPEKGGGTCVDTYEFPVQALPRTGFETAGDFVFGVAGAHSTRYLMRLPTPLAEVLVGSVCAVQKMPRCGGTAVFVTTASPLAPEAVRRTLAQRLVRAGWTIDPRNADLATRKNLSVLLTVRSVEPGLTISVFRFADDENYERKGNKQDEE